jgi:diguanylate cyclase (GGDEF)-like protein/PAS domain S-box-containing protein
MAPWREAAKRRGYQSSIALPLVVNKQISGALTLYSIEPFAFGKEEVALLEELSNDLAFGIETLRTRIEHASMQADLKKESEKNLALLRNASDGIHILDANGQVIEASDSFCTMLGYRRDEMIGMSVSQWDAELSDTHLPEMIAKHFAQHVRSQFETRHRRKDGTTFDVEVSGFPLELDGKPVLFYSSRDITERKHQENHIHENEQRLLDILNASPIAVRIAIKNGREVVFYNQSYADLIKNVQAIGDDPERYYVRADDYEEVLAELARGHSVISRQIELNIPGGSTAWVLATYMPMRYQGEEAVLGWFYDITERRQAEIALQESQEKLQAILNASEVAVAWANEAGEIEYVNPKFTRLFGYTLEEVPTVEQWYLRAYPDTIYRMKLVDEWNTKITLSIARKTAIESMEAKVSCKDGSIRHVIVMGSWAGTRLLANFSDITERKLAEELLLKQKQFSDDVINSLPGIFYMLNQKGSFIRVNRQFQEVSGFSSEELVNLSALSFFGENDRNTVAQKIQEVFVTGNAWVEADFITRSGQNIPYSFSGHRTRIDDQFYVVGLGTDISERKRLAHQLDEREELFGAIFNQSPIGIELIDPETLQFVEVNPAACRMLGYTHEEFLHLRLLDTQADSDEATLAAALRQVDVSDGATFDTRHRTKKGEILDVEVNARMLNFPGKRLLIGIWRDITERKRAEEDLRIIASVFENTQEAIMITDANNAIVDVNSAFTRITGFCRDEVIGQDPKILSLGEQSKDFYVRMWRSIQQTGGWRGEIWNRRKSGEIYAGMLSISAISNAEAKIQRYVGVFSDISHIKKHEAELKRIAHFDALTGIPNRSLLADRMKQALAQTSREKNMMAVCYLDLDGFKPINDTWGHDAGDQVLIEVAKRIGSTIRGGDTVARLGGDEFVILLLKLEKGEECMATLERLLTAISLPITVKDKFQTISASIGVSLYPMDNEDPDTLLRHADQAMYVAKQSGKNRFHIYDPALDMRARDHQDFLKNISDGLDLNQFELYYQPKVNLQTKKLVGAEALIRWRHPERGLLSPGEFLSTIENTELDIKIGNWVLATALAQLDRWHQTGLNIEVSINISAYHLESPRFAENLGRHLEQYPDLPSRTLQIEVLETAALNDIGIVREVIEKCHLLGVGFALDDFGTGYSSLSYLSNLPVDVLKIDQSFVRDMLEDEGDMAIVQGIIALARAFDRQTVAEGIETDEHFRVLLEMGCELGQGYGIARPMQAADLTNWRIR